MAGLVHALEAACAAAVYQTRPMRDLSGRTGKIGHDGVKQAGGCAPLIGGRNISSATASARFFILSGITLAAAMLLNILPLTHLGSLNYLKKE